MSKNYLVDLQAEKLPIGIGGKGEKLFFLKKHGFRVPNTLVCRYPDNKDGGKYDKTIRDPLLLSELRQVLDPAICYAVRSSANLEDSLKFSFAGQLKTRLGICGVEDVHEAIVEIQSSAYSPEVASYLKRNGLNQNDLSVAVIVQEMVEPVVSGVAFSKNPTTGLDEIVVEMVKGSGETLVQDGVTPDRWIYKWGQWIEEPERGTALNDLVLQVVNETKRIAQTYGAPVDLEWIYDGQKLWWVQLREITALDDLHIYSNRISREVLPGIIKPLVWSINVPLVNSAWIRLFTELIGPNEMEPDDLSRAFYYRAYFNMSTVGTVFDELGMPRESLELLMGIEAGKDKPGFRPRKLSYRHIARLLRMIIDKLGFGRKTDSFLPRMKSVFSKFNTTDFSKNTDQEILLEIENLYAFIQEAAYFNIVVPLLHGIYASILRRLLGDLNVDFEQLDITLKIDGLEMYDPNLHLTRLHDLFHSLDEPSKKQVRSTNHDEFIKLKGIEHLQNAVNRFIDQFGHLSDSGNDFSSTPWRENPDLILSMVTSHSNTTRNRQLLSWEDLNLSIWQRFYFGPIYKQARAFHLHREAVSFYYTYGYGLFRNYFLEIGRRFCARAMIDSPADIFYLYRNEVEEVVKNTADSQILLRKTIEERKVEIDSYRDVILPDIIFGDEQPPLENVEHLNFEQLKGTPTSRGYYEGPVCVIRSINDFDKLKSGDVLVIPYSDVSWTPLFAKAGAVIAESGGLLSHSSIVAREYNLPAVVSVTGACQIPDGTVVSIDGYKGNVVIHSLQKDMP